MQKKANNKNRQNTSKIIRLKRVKPINLVVLTLNSKIIVCLSKQIGNNEPSKLLNRDNINKSDLIFLPLSISNRFFVCLISCFIFSV